MRVLVTGGCGFLGAAVVRQAIERGDHVLNLDRRRKATPCPQLGNTNGAKGYARIEADVILDVVVGRWQRLDGQAIDAGAGTHLAGAEHTGTGTGALPQGHPQLLARTLRLLYGA